MNDNDVLNVLAPFSSTWIIHRHKKTCFKFTQVVRKGFSCLSIKLSTVFFSPVFSVIFRLQENFTTYWIKRKTANLEIGIKKQ